MLKLFYGGLQLSHQKQIPHIKEINNKQKTNPSLKITSSETMVEVNLTKIEATKVYKVTSKSETERFTR